MHDHRRCSDEPHFFWPDAVSVISFLAFQIEWTNRYWWHYCWDQGPMMHQTPREPKARPARELFFFPTNTENNLSQGLFQKGWNRKLGLSSASKAHGYCCTPEHKTHRSFLVDWIIYLFISNKNQELFCGFFLFIYFFFSLAEDIPVIERKRWSCFKGWELITDA